MLDTCSGKLTLARSHALNIAALQEKALRAYKQYGEGNEHAQKVLYELEDKPTFKAFFLVSSFKASV